MQSKISCFNGTIFRKNILRYWPIWLIYFGYLFCCVPMEIFISTSMVESTNGLEDIIKWDKMDAYFMALANTLQPEICFTIAVIAALAVFHHMYFTRSAHAYYSFPVRREELFLTAYLSGFMFYTVPLILNFLMGCCVCGVKGITSLEYLLYWFLLMEGMCFFFYNMTILVGMFTGVFFAVPVLTLALNYLYVGCRTVILAIMGMISYGLSDIYAERQVSFLSPLYFMTEKVNFNVRTEETENLYLVNGEEYIAIYAVLGIICGAIAFCMYRKRKAENIGEVFVVRVVKPVFRWVFAAVISMLVAMIVCGMVFVSLPDAQSQFILVLVVILVLGILCFFVAEMLLQKKFLVFGMKRWIECGVYSAVMAVFLICAESNVFGFENKLPEESEIASVQMSAYYPLCADDEQRIEEILQIHQKIIDSKEEFEAYYANSSENGGDFNHVTIYYKLKDGTPFIRNYIIPSGEEYLDDEDSAASDIWKLSCDVDMYMKGNVCLNYEEVELQGISIDVYNEELESDTVEIEEKYRKIFMEAFKKDILEGNLLYNNMADWDEEDGLIYWNSIIIDLHSENGIVEYWDEWEWENSQMEEMSFMLSFNKECSHVLDVLNKLGIVNSSDKQLLTYQEYTRIETEMLGE